MNSVAITNETAFTAAQIALALSKPDRALRRMLDTIPANGSRIIGGREAKTWYLCALPGPLQTALESAAQNGGWRNAEHMLAAPPAPLPPHLPLAEASPAAIQHAHQLRDVLSQFLADDPDTLRDLDRRGPAEYQRIFGHAISSVHFRRLLSRARQRDLDYRCGGNWMNLQLYLPANAMRRADSAATVKARWVHRELQDVLDILENRAQPTHEDRALLLDAAFAHLETLTAQNPGCDKAIKRSLRDYLCHAMPALAPTAKAMKLLFNRKFSLWLANGKSPAAIRDQRALASGNFRKPDFSADEKKIRDESILHDGNIALAHRKLRERGDLSENFVNYYGFNPRHNKSYVPETVRNNITPQVQMCGPLHHGPWLAKMRGPYIPRDWSAVHPGDWFSGDDVTWNSYFYYYDEAGQLHIERGECLVLHDLRTGYILDYTLIAGKYNSRHIRRLITKVHDRYGLPHNGFYFERSVWKARIIRDLDSRENVHWRETESGLAQYNLQVRHATTPRAKPIEGLFRILQERQRNEPGFVGFNERLDERERMQDFLARARRGAVKPQDQLLSMEQWASRLNEIFRDFNQDVQNGKMLPGLSPAEAWLTGLQRRPLRQLPEDARYLLSTHCQRLTIRQQGIVLAIGGNKMLFCNERTGQLIGREVLAYYNLDCPELLTVSDLKRQNYFTVKALSLPAMTATKEQFAPVHAAITGHRKPAKEIYGNIQRQNAHTITRDDDASAETKELGRFVNNSTAQFQHEKTVRAGKSKAVARRAAATGLVLSQPVRDLEDAGDAIDRLGAARARARAHEKGIEQ